MLHARQIVTPSPIGPLSTAELLNPDPHWARLETLRLLDDFWYSLEQAEALRQAFVILADILLLSLAASFNKAGPSKKPLPRVSAYAANPIQNSAVIDLAPQETIARAFAALCGMILEESARRLELVDLATALPALRMTAYEGTLSYVAHDPDLNPRNLLRRCHAVTAELVRDNLACSLHGLRRITDELTTTASGPPLLHLDRFGIANKVACASRTTSGDCGSDHDTAATIQRLMASLQRLQTRQKVLRSDFDVSSSEAVETGK